MSGLNRAYGPGVPELNVTPPAILSSRDPATSDTGYAVGQVWVNQTASPREIFFNCGDAAGVATWVNATTAGAVMEVDTDSGTATPVAGVLELLGTAAQGISSSASGNTVTLTIADATTAQKGVAQTATDGEAQAKAATDVTLTPSNLAALGASTSFAGLVELATAAEAQAMSSSTVAITPSNLANLAAGTNITLNANPILQSSATTGAAPTGTTGAVNIMALQEGEIMEEFILGAGQTIIAPRMSADGLLISLDLTNTEGAEYNFGTLAVSKHRYTIGTSAAFYIEAAIRVADVSGLDPLLVGFRRLQSNDATLTNYTDFAAIGLASSVSSTTLVISTQLNTGGLVQTNTTDTWTDATVKTLRVLVSASGVVTYTINGVAPTVTAAFTFDNTDIVIPFIRHTFSATSPGQVHLQTLKIGLQ